MRKRKRNSTICAIMAAIVLTIIILPNMGINSKAEPFIEHEELTRDNINLTTTEMNTLSEISESIQFVPETINTLIQNQTFSNFLDAIALNKMIVSEKMSQETSNDVEALGIDTNETVRELRIAAQDYLDKNEPGLEIGTPEFEKFLVFQLENETNGVSEKAKSDPGFANLYMYMSIYEMLVIPSEDSTVINYSEYNSYEDMDNYSLKEIIEMNSEQNYIDNKVLDTLNTYAKLTATSSAWSKLNSTKILTYARKYAKSYNSAYYVENKAADCTNFASQCLKAGGLSMNYQNSDKTANKIINTTKRWFNFYNSSTKKYGVSTSWIRVVDLYSYLSPHYSTYSSTLRYNIKNNLVAGDLLQGANIVGRYTHSVIATKQNGEWCYCAHSAARLDEPLDTFFNGFYKFRVVKCC